MITVNAYLYDDFGNLNYPLLEGICMNGEKKAPMTEARTLLDRIGIHNAPNQEARDPHGYPEMENHPLRKEYLEGQEKLPG